MKIINKISAKDVLASKFFIKASNKAKDYLHSPEKLRNLINDAKNKAEKKTDGPIFELWDSLSTCFRLLKAYSKRDYSAIPWQSLLLIVASIVYFVMPVDVIPDFILAAGFIDDAALLGLTFKSVSSDLADFHTWEDSKKVSEETEKTENKS